jgi:hypothetical protein
MRRRHDERQCSFRHEPKADVRITPKGRDPKLVRDITGETSSPRIVRWGERYPLAVAILVCLACLLPFVHKAFHIDDPLFLWAARQIREHPLDFYGFNVYWYFNREPMATVTKNPPLTAHYIALVSLVTGWRETPLHLAMLVWPLAAVWGMYCLAERFTARPLLATLAAILTPVFLVSSTSLMCDTMTLCIWVWAIVLWDRGLDGRWGPLIASGMLMALCPLAKYFGISLVPLLLVYGFLRKRRPGKWLLVLLIPLLALGAYEWHTWSLYGKPLFAYATIYSGQLRQQFHLSFDPWGKTLVGIAFLGGCVASPLFFAPFLGRRRRMFLFLFAVGGALTLFLMYAAWNTKDPRLNELEHLWGPSPPEQWHVLTQSLFSIAGLAVFLLAAADLWSKPRDAGSWLLFLWVVGTFVFAAYVNWSVNGRSILPLVPAVGILLARALDRQRGTAPPRMDWSLAWPLAPAAALALMVAWADYWQADSARAAAERFRAEYGAGTQPVWYQGHWGFGYYMNEFGFPVPDLHVVEYGGRRFFDVASTDMKPGDVMIAPTSNTYVVQPPRRQVSSHEFVTSPSCSWAATMNVYVHAGFYADTSGGRHPLPYGFGRTLPEVYIVYTIGSPDRPAPPSVQP